MAVKLAGYFVSGFRTVLHDDHYVSDHRCVWIWSILIFNPSGTVLCSLYYDSSEILWHNRNLSFTAGSRCADSYCLYLLGEKYEKNSVRTYGKAIRKIMCRIPVVSGFFYCVGNCFLCNKKHSARNATLRGLVH